MLESSSSTHPWTTSPHWTQVRQSRNMSFCWLLEVHLTLYLTSQLLEVSSVSRISDSTTAKSTYKVQPEIPQKDLRYSAQMNLKILVYLSAVRWRATNKEYGTCSSGARLSSPATHVMNILLTILINVVMKMEWFQPQDGGVYIEDFDYLLKLTKISSKQLSLKDLAGNAFTMTFNNDGADMSVGDIIKLRSIASINDSGDAKTI